MAGADAGPYAGSLTGKVAIVTGAAQGIGEATARLLAERGARVVIADVAAERGAALAAELGEAALFARLDVTDAAAWTAAVALAVERFGTLNVLVNNAAVVRHGSIEEQPAEDYAAVVGVIQHGAWLGIKSATAAMRAAGGGSIVNVASVGGMRGTPRGGAYVSAKWALRGLTKTAAAELGGDGIRVNAVLPGPIATPMTTPAGDDGAFARAYAGLPLGRIGTADEIARVIAFLASDESSYCTGGDYLSDGGLMSTGGWAGLDRSGR